MLNILDDVLKSLPSLLKEEDGWQSLYIDYERPVVERVWTHYKGYRVYLHCIHHLSEGERPYLHYHPWPSAMYIVQGHYKMVSDSGEGTPQMTTLLSPGSRYEMVDPSLRHSVEPIEDTILSVMVTGTPYQIKPPMTRPLNILDPLPLERVAQILELFK